jgi:hypothetical protein
MQLCNMQQLTAQWKQGRHNVSQPAEPAVTPANLQQLTVGFQQGLHTVAAAAAMVENQS